MVQRTDGELFWDGATALTNADSSAFVAAPGAFAATGQSNGFACAVDDTASAGLWCVGYDNYGNLGAGLTTTTQYTTMVQVETAMSTPLTGITQVAVDPYEDSTACAIGASGAVWCWGYYGNGVLGSGAAANENYATPVLTSAGGAQFTGATQISVSYDHACAVVGGSASGGSVYCWGYNASGQIGQGSTSPNYYYYPTKVANLFSSVLSVSVGYQYTCALTTDQTVWCWGNNVYGIVGNGTSSGTYPAPVQVQTVADGDGGSPFGGVAAMQVGASSYGSVCAVKASGGGMWCWGENASSNGYIPTKYAQGGYPVTNVFQLCTNGSYYPSFIDDTGAMNYDGSQTTQVSCP